MTPLERAQAVYREGWCARTFWEDFKLYLRYGSIISFPDVFVMGRPVKTGWSPQMILNPENTTDDPDCWHIALYAGDLNKAPDFVDCNLGVACLLNSLAFTLEDVD